MSCLRTVKYQSRANIVSVSVILPEKLKFMYSVNRFVAFMPLFCTKTLKAVHRLKCKIAYAVHIL